MRVLVTGGAGFLGHHLVQGLEQKDIVLLDTADPIEAGVPPTTRYFRGDVRDSRLLETALQDCDAVVHAAAGLPLMPKAEIASVNREGTKTVLESCAKMNVDKIIHISSTAVYQNTYNSPAKEDAPVQGVGPYGASKIEAEELCSKARKRGQPVCVLRPKTFVGAGRLGVFQILLEWIAEGRKIPVLGAGNNRYQLLAVEDLITAIDLILALQPEKTDGVFNVGANCYRTVAEDLGSLFAHAKTGSRILPIPAFPAKAALAVAGATGLSPLYRWVWATADKNSEVDTSKLQNLNWKPQSSNAETLIAAWDWYRANRENLPKPGKNHRSPWNEGILGFARKLL